MERKKLPIGIDSFEKLRREDFCYVDKTGLIRELLNNWGRCKPDARPQAYWINTSGNEMVKRFVRKADKTTQNEIESLIARKRLLRRKSP